jgi:hypothetical protein
MFKKLFTLSILFFFIVVSASAQCKIAEIVKNNKPKIVSPYIFDGFIILEFFLLGEVVGYSCRRLIDVKVDGIVVEGVIIGKKGIRLNPTHVCNDLIIIR